MDLPFAARLPRPFASPAPRGRGAPARGRPPAAGALARAPRAALASAWRRRGTRIALLVALAAMPVLAGGWLWLRQSPFVAVEHVQIGGVHGQQAAEIDAALMSAARRMSTLDAHAGTLLAAVSAFPVVREIHVRPRFPHGLRIEVVEQPPVAALVVGGARTAVAADGVVLGPALLSGSLPTVDGYHEALAGHHVSGPSVLAALSVLGAAPAPLRRDVAKAYTGAEGLTLAMRSGLLAYFGDATRPHAKWLSLIAVLSDSGSKGASYVDVRLPSRPAAGFPAGVTPPDASATETASTGESAKASEATVASLAASLESTAGGSIATSASASAAAGATTGTSTPETQSPPAEASTEAAVAPSGETAPEVASPGG